MHLSGSLRSLPSSKNKRGERNSVSRHRRTNRYFKSWTKKTLTRRRPVQTPSCTVGLINEFTRWNIITDSKRSTSPVSPPCDRVCSSLCCLCCENKPQSCRPPTFDPWPAHWPPHQPGSVSRWTHADVHTHTHTIFCSYQTSSQKFWQNNLTSTEQTLQVNSVWFG